MRQQLHKNGDMDDSSKKILTSGLLVGIVLTALLGGLALVVRSLQNVELKLNLELKKDDSKEKKY